MTNGLKSLTFFLLFYGYNSEPHPKSKCSLECYSLCMRSGTPSSTTCNCPVPKNAGACDSFSTQMKNISISLHVPKTRSTYVDAHMIRVAIEPQILAFAYVFEYSLISSEPDQWIFAGASPNPEATFSILDPCRDYQFRVFIVIRTSNPQHVFEIIRPQPIPVKLPQFILTQEQIKVELPTLSNSTTEGIKMYVKWTLPSGYIDGDIYGYESPALYPIQCSTPEGELPQPRIEIVKGGGRLAVGLPAAVLEARCRMWVEVRMLPRCVRLEPFNIQKNIEIDCSKNSELEVCSKDSNPLCFENVEIAGEKGNARISWTEPTKKPLYYHVRYGPAQTKGVAPFVSWQLAAKREVRVDGSLNTFTLDIPEDEDFGVQVCAILSKKRKRPKFGVIQVIPFQCSSCKTPQNDANGRCGECSTVLGSTVVDRDWATKVPQPRTPATQKQKPTVYRMETDLAVSANKNEPTTKSVAKSDTRHSTDSPIELEKAEEINKEQQEIRTTTEKETEIETTTAFPTPESTESSSTTTTVALTTEENTESSPMGIFEITEDTLPTTTEIPITTIVVPEAESVSPLLISQQVEEAIEKAMKSSVGENTLRKNTEIVSEKLSLNTTIASVTMAETDAKIQETIQEATKKLQETLSNLSGNSSSNEIRLHESSKKCLTNEGVVCEFGCENRKTCICPSSTHARLRNGICASRDTMLHTICFPRKEINATWDAESGNIMVRRSDALYHIESAENVDKLFVEFGKAQISDSTNNETRIEFKDNSRSKIVVQIQTLLKSSVFSSEPFIFHVNQTIDINTTYGMRFCVFNSSQVRHPHDYNWDDISKFEMLDQIAEVIQLSPVKFTNKLQLLGNEGETYWSTVVTIAKISILVALALAMFILVYLNCTKIKTLYDRKRTHYFRPFYIDPSIHLSSSVPSTRSSAGLKREPSRGYYDVRSSHLIM